MKTKSITLNKNKTILTILKGAINALIVSLLAILAFAFIIKLTNISDAFIKPINQIIKVVSIFFGCFIAFKKDDEKTLFKGIFIGGLYVILAFLLFSALNGSFEFSPTIFLDILFGLIVGAICAIITNIFRKK